MSNGENKKPEAPEPKAEAPEAAEPSNPILDELLDLVDDLGKLRNTKVYPYLLMPFHMDRDIVEQNYEFLEQQYKGTVDLDVLVTSSGGDIHPAYHLAKLFRRYASGKLRFIVPRYAKSAATVLIFGGDEIIFGPTSEMGPLDPQIPLPPKTSEKQLSRFSPLAIRPTLDLIAEENEKGHTILVEKLSASLPDALVLGQHLKALEIAKHYVMKLLTSRMLKGVPNADAIAAKIGDDLVSGYPDHSCCVDFEDALSLGLKISIAPDDQWELIWKIWRLAEKFMKDDNAKAKKSAASAKHDILA